MPWQLSPAFKRTKSTLLECLHNMGMGEVHTHLFSIFPKSMYPLCPVFLVCFFSVFFFFLSVFPCNCLVSVWSDVFRPTHQRVTAYLRVLDLGQLICLLIPQKGRNIVGRCMVHCDFKLLVLSQTSSHISAPHSGRGWTSQLSFSAVLSTK